MPDIRSLAGVLKRNGTHISARIDIQDRIFIQVLGFCDSAVPEFDVERIGTFEITHLHDNYSIITGWEFA
jgi:hypothetical protein